MPHSSPTPAADPDIPSVAWSDSDLLAAIAMHADDQGLANAAFAVFLDRWQDLLLGHVHLLCRYPPANRIGDRVVESETWFRVFRKAGTFQAQDLAGDALTARTAGWLKTIATHALRDQLRRTGHPHLCALSDDIVAAPRAIPAALTGQDARQAIVAGCLQRLSEREADVLRTSAGFITTDGSVAGMPSEVREKLLRRYETTEANLRQIRRRAYGKLKACVEPQLAKLA